MIRALTSQPGNVAEILRSGRRCHWHRSAAPRPRSQSVRRTEPIRSSFGQQTFPLLKKAVLAADRRQPGWRDGGRGG
jgi:hypothetical protein